MSDYTRNQAHVEQGLDRLLERFKGRPKIEALLRIFLERVQHIDDVIYDLYTGMWLDNAVGEQLDSLGWIVGESRASRSDYIYRLWIRARIKINRANGKVSDTLEVLRLLVEPTALVEYLPEYPAAYRVRVTGTTADASTVSAIIQQVKPAGVGLTTEVVFDLATALIWDDVGAAHVWDAGEWSDTV